MDVWAIELFELGELNSGLISHSDVESFSRDIAAEKTALRLKAVEWNDQYDTPGVRCSENDRESMRHAAMNGMKYLGCFLCDTSPLSRNNGLVALYYNVIDVR